MNITRTISLHTVVWSELSLVSDAPNYIIYETTSMSFELTHTVWIDLHVFMWVF